MKVFLFSIDREKVGGFASGQAIVAANNVFEAWDALVSELPEYDLECFSAENCEEIHSLTSLLTEAAVITYNCYCE